LAAPSVVTTASSAASSVPAQPDIGRVLIARARRAWSQRRSTPTRLVLARAVLVAVIALFALVSVSAIGRRGAALRDTRDAAQQLIAVQEIRVDAVRADSIAISSYLVGGEERSDDRAQYLAALGEVNQNIVDVAAGASAGDRQRLAEVSQLLTTYTGLVEQARTNNRQGFPVGAAYQRAANRVVAFGGDESSIVGVLRDIETSQRNEVNRSLDQVHAQGWWLHVFAVLVVALMALLSWWLAMRFRRTLNVPIIAAGVLVLVAWFVVGDRQGSAASSAERTVAASLQRADHVAQGRAAAFEARAQEALALVNRGNGAANEAAWAQATFVVDESMRLADDRCAPDRCLADSFGSYAAVHEELRALDDQGDWDAAVAAALGVGGDGQPNARRAFEAFDQEASAEIASEVAAVGDSFDAAVGRLDGMRTLLALMSVAAAVLAIVGVGSRLREYR
jgi:hypothetical protein